MSNEKIEIKRNKRKILSGVVISDSMDKTRIIKVESTFRHPKYEKAIVRYKKYYAHDETNQTKIGDLVEIISSRPLSKLKRWRIYKVITKKNI